MDLIFWADSSSIWAWGYKTFFMFNSNQQEKFHAQLCSVGEKFKLLVFNFLYAEQISFSAEMSMKKV